jgi:hypothetical protein
MVIVYFLYSSSTLPLLVLVLDPRSKIDSGRVADLETRLLQPYARCVPDSERVLRRGGRMTRNLLLRLHILLLVALTTVGCQAVEGIFKAGMWVGILVAVVIVGLILMLFGRSRT